jgi:general secretion pathway protein M
MKPRAAYATASAKARWDALAPRERRLLRGALALIVVALLWWLLLAPALHTLRDANAERGRLARS